ncbi:MAG: hypothetical protein J1F05_07435 [Muribaculaceae bacterium]|nr:hypothetical protein [Muribaculaceae bacterium]
MKKITCTITILLAAAIAMPAAVSAQDPFDDLYYSPSKAAEKKKKQEEEARAAAQAAQAAYLASDYASADTYSEGSTMPLNIDVDAYNRRTTSDTTSVAASSLPEDDFSYTRRIERYHNPAIVSESGDADLIDYYYSTPSQQDINMYIINDVNPYYYGWASPYYSPYYYPYYYSSFYRPHYYYGYHSWYPGWHLSWGYDPWFDFSFGWGYPWHNHYHGWGWSWGWGHGWHNPVPPKPYPGHSGTQWANSPGASRPHGAGTSTVGNRTNSSQTRYNPSTSSRPGNLGRTTANSTTGTVKPTNQSSKVGTTTTSTPSNNSRRGSTNTTTTTRQSSSSSSSGSYRSSSTTSRSSSSSYGSGSNNSSRGGSSSSGARSGASSAGRGRR